VRNAGCLFGVFEKATLKVEMRVELEGASGAELAFYGKKATHESHQLRGNGETETSTTIAAGR
jgi:hypothetical protein